MYGLVCCWIIISVTVFSFRSLTTKRPYDPPEDVEERLLSIVKNAVPNAGKDWKDISLESPEIKFKVG